MTTRSVSVGAAVAAFFCLSTIAGFAILVLLTSGLAARAEGDGQDPGERAVRQIEIHTKAETPGSDIPFEPGVEATVTGSILEGGEEPVFESRRIILGIDRAQLLRLNGTVDTIVIGNPIIADAAVYDQSTLVLTGKAFGETNIIVMDGAGNVIREAEIRVGQPDDVVVVNRGANQMTYSCAPTCSRTLRIGDNGDAFDATLSQTQAIIDLNAGISGTR